MKYVKVFKCDSCIDKCFILVTTLGKETLRPSDITPPCPMSAAYIESSSIEELEEYIEHRKVVETCEACEA